MMINFGTLTFNTIFIIKVVFILTALTVILFGFLLARQVELLDQFLKTPLGKWVRLASVFYLVTTIISLGLILALL